MTRVDEFHRRAMEVARRATLAREAGSSDESCRLFREALSLERKAADLVDATEEPARSILHRSAVALSIAADELAIGQAILDSAFRGEPPSDLRAELEELQRRLRERQSFARDSDEYVANLMRHDATGTDLSETDLISTLRAAMRHAGRQRSATGHHTLQVTSIVNSAFERVAKTLRTRGDRRSFLIKTSSLVRHILVDLVRKRRDSSLQSATEEPELIVFIDAYDARSIDLIALDAALDALRAEDALLAQLVDLRFFGGQPLTECAAILGISERASTQGWRIARARLYRAIKPEPPASSGE